MKTTVISIAIALFALANLNSASGKEKVYKNVESENNIVTVTSYLGENDLNIHPYKKSETRMDENNKPAERIYYLWSSKKGTWVESQRYIYIYGAENSLISFTYSEWDNKQDNWLSGTSQIINTNDSSYLTSK